MEERAEEPVAPPEMLPPRAEQIRQFVHAIAMEDVDLMLAPEVIEIANAIGRYGIAPNETCLICYDDTQTRPGRR
jgi:ethanolamine utilization microcompartment shell protein EutS